jgi:hypothetical protein
MFASKGCGAVGVFTILTDFAPFLAWLTAEQNTGANSILVSPASGAIVGLQDYPMMLPGVLPVLLKACKVAAAVVAAAVVAAAAGVSAVMGGA